MVRDIESNHSRFRNPSRVWINERWYELPGHLLDFTYRKKREAITIADFEEAARKTGRQVGPGSAIVCWTGVDKDWQQPGFLTKRPFVPTTTAQWLLDRKITLFATDLIWMDDPDEQPIRPMRFG
jgi:arylformamidase